MRWALLVLCLCVAGPLAAGPDDACAVCGGPPGSATREPVVHGRKVSLCDASYCEEAVRADPQRYLGARAPRSALFRDEMDYAPGADWSAFGLGLGALALVGVIAAVAHRRLSAAAGGEVPPGLGRIPSTPRPAACPACGAENHPSARACARCRAGLEPHAGSEVERA